MAASNIYLGVILVIAIIIIAYFAWRRWKAKRRTEGFSYGTPATPRVREAVGALFANLKNLVALGQSLEAQAARTGEAGSGAAERLSVAQMISALEGAEKALSGAPPTYANYLAIYRGLTGADATLKNAADAYTAAGYELHQVAARAATTGAPPSGEQAALGNALIQVGQQLRLVTASVHRLGVALDVE